MDAVSQPASAGLDAQHNRTFRQQSRHHLLGRTGVGDAPARGRLVEGQAEAHVARRGDGGHAPGGGGHGAGQGIGAGVAAEQGCGGAAVLGDGNDGGLGALVSEQRRQGADKDAGGAHADDGPALGKQAAQIGRHFGEHLVGAVGAPGQTMHAGTGQDGSKAAGQLKSARAEGDQGCAGRHLSLDGHRFAASAPTRTIEK